MTSKPRGRAGLFAAICALSFLVNYSRVAFAPLVDHFIESGVSPATAGLAATAVWTGSALSRLPTGYLLTFVRRHVALIGMGSFLAVSAAVTALSPTIGFTVAGALLLGLATGVYFIAANPLVSELYPDRVGAAIGIRGVFSQLAAVCAPFLVSLAILLGSWRLGFWMLAAGSLLVTAGLAVAARRAELPTAGSEDRNLLSGIRAQWRLIVAGIVFVGIAGFVWQGVFNFYVTYLGAEKGLPAGTATSLLTLTFAAGVPSFFAAGRIADRYGYLPVLLSILGGFGCCLLAFTVVEGTIAIAAVSIAMGLVVHGLFPVGDAYLLETLPDENRASAYSGFSATMMMLQAPGSVAVGALAQGGIAYTDVFRSYAATVVVIAVCMALLARVGRVPTGK